MGGEWGWGGHGGDRGEVKLCGQTILSCRCCTGAKKKQKKNEARGGDTRLVLSHMLITTTRMHVTKAIFNLDFKKS